MRDNVVNKALRNALDQLKDDLLIYMMTFFVMTLLPMFYTVYKIKQRGGIIRMEKLLSLMFIFTIFIMVICASALLIVNHVRLCKRRHEYLGIQGLKLICLESMIVLIVFLAITSFLFMIMSYTFMMDLNMFIKMLIGYTVFHSLILIQNVTNLSQ